MLCCTCCCAGRRYRRSWLQLYRRDSTRAHDGTHDHSALTKNKAQSKTSHFTSDILCTAASQTTELIHTTAVFTGVKLYTVQNITFYLGSKLNVRSVLTHLQIFHLAHEPRHGSSSVFVCSVHSTSISWYGMCWWWCWGEREAGAVWQQGLREGDAGR